MTAADISLLSGLIVALFFFLSLDNLFVFLLLFAYFGVPYERRPRLLFWGIVAALALRGLFILGGSALIEQFHFVIYPLGGALILLAYRMFRGVQENVDPDRNFMVRLVRRFYPVTGEFHGGPLVVRGGPPGGPDPPVPS